MIKNVKRALARKRRHIRLRKKVKGTAARPRLSVFKSLKQIYVQIIDDEGKKLELLIVHTEEL